MDFAHPVERKAEGLAALDKHGSIRKAAAVTGIPKSTIHRWAQGEDGSDATGQSDVVTDDVTEPGVISSGDQTIVAQVIPPMEEPAPVPLSADGPIGWSDPLYLKAFHRYTSLLANGVSPVYAMPAAQQVCPAFTLDPDTDQRLQATVGAMTFGESHSLLFANPDPPAYVQRIVDAYSLTDADTAAMSDAMYAAKVDAYQTAVNDGLSKMGRDPITNITDQKVLDSLRSKSDNAIAGIADTWNRDAANAAGSAWVDAYANHRAGEARKSGAGYAAQRQDDITQSMNDWAGSREDWKAALWASDGVNDAYTQAQLDFITQNAGLVERCRVTPDDCVCDGCQELVDIGWMSADDAATLDLPLHPGCAHSIETEVSQPEDGDDVWAAQAA